MTMPNAFHPDDERLAAYAGGDADAVSDRALIDHLATCDRCAPLVEELGLLRSALATLPDLLPSRPLRLIPPVPAAAPDRAGPLGWLRRLAAPAMAAGAGLVLVGAVGMSGVVESFSGMASAPDPAALEGQASSEGAAESVSPPAGEEFLRSHSPALGPTTGAASGSPRSQDNASSAAPSVKATASEPEASRDEGGTTAQVTREGNGEEPWLTVLIAGAALFAVSSALRLSLTPRAG